MKHGHTAKGKKSGAWLSWKAMRNRCLHPGVANYPQYGGRGIRICDRWLEFKNFYSDMGDRPPGFSLDRIDVNGDYSAANCRWADNKTQSRNRRNSRLLTYKDQTRTMTEWSEILGLKSKTMFMRRAAGWTDEEILSTPHRSKKGYNNFKGNIHK